MTRPLSFDVARRAALALASTVLLVASSTAAAAPFTVVVNKQYATQPSFNDHGEIVYIELGTLISTVRGVIATGVDASNIGIANSGEVVYADGSSTSRVISTERGVLTGYRSYAPTIASTTGEVAYLGNVTSFAAAHVFTTLQGQVESFDQSFYAPIGVGDVNDSGEVVFELRVQEQPYTRIYSTTRGFVTPDGVNAIQPAINNRGEVVYSGVDAFGRQQIFSTVRGQLTFFGGDFTFSSADLPDIDNFGNVIFRGTISERTALYRLSVPEPSALLLLLSGLVMLTWLRLPNALGSPRR